MTKLYRFAGSIVLIASAARAQQVSVAAYGAAAGSGKNATSAVRRALDAAKTAHAKILMFPKGTYDFWPEGGQTGQYFITNHDPMPSRSIAIPVDGMENLTIDGGGSTFLFHGELLPIALMKSANITLQNVTLDVAKQRFVNTRILKTMPGATEVQVLPGQHFSMEGDRVRLATDDGWSALAGVSLEIDPKTMAVAAGEHDDYQFAKRSIQQTGPDTLLIKCLQGHPTAGNLLVLRGRERTNPVIWTSESRNVTVSHVTVHGGLGMGFVAQRSEDLHLDGFNILLGPGRYLTTNADATHFNMCRGKIVVENGTTENMLDDGINVHGSFLRVDSVSAPGTVTLAWGHIQTYGFTFAKAGEHLQFTEPATLLAQGSPMEVKSVTRIDDQHIRVEFTGALPADVKPGVFVENADWQPNVVYRNNTVRRIRSRGALFSTLGGVLVEGNRFDHLAGAGVLVPGEAKDWYESTPSQHMVIRHNTFVDTNLGRPNQAAITIMLTLDAIAPAAGYGHRDIVVEDNDFMLLGRRMLQAISLDGLVFRNNRLAASPDFPAVAGTTAFGFEHARCLRVQGNTLPAPLTAADFTLKDTRELLVDAVPQLGGAQSFEAACKQ